MYSQCTLVLQVIMKTLFTILVLFFTSSLTAEEAANWGIITDTCENSLAIISLSKEIGDFEHDLTNKIYRGVMQSYMSGINNWTYEKFGMFKHLNYNSIDYAYSYLQNYCEKNPNNQIVDGVIQYFVELPFIEN